MNTASTCLRLHGSTPRPDRSASDRIHFRKGVNAPPPTTINSVLLRLFAQVATWASLSGPTSYGSCLWKFHLFCDLFHIPETDRPPALCEFLRSFEIWAASDPEVLGSDLWKLGEFELVLIQTAGK